MEVISIEEVGIEEVVYDLETDCGTFVAGGLSNGILVKNTDSCYVRFPIYREDYEEYGDNQEEEFMKANFVMAEQCAEYCTSQFKPPIELAFEKYMYPLVLYAKKRYAYKEWVKYSNPEASINYKGLQLVRRDTCRYVKEELNKAFEIIFDQTSSEMAKNASLPFIRESVSNLLNGNLDYNKLILSKQLKARYKVRKGGNTNEYHWTNRDIQLPHVRLAQELKDKNPANHPAPPDRVPYLFIQKKGENLLQCDKVIHPNNFDPSVDSIDSIYYFEKQYMKPIDTIFKFIIEDTGQIYNRLLQSAINKFNGQPEITDFFKKVKKKDTSSEYKYKYNPDLEVEFDSDSDTGV